MYTQDFGDGDYCTLVSITVNDIYSNTGTLTIMNGDGGITNTFKFDPFDGPNDVCA